MISVCSKYTANTTRRRLLLTLGGLMLAPATLAEPFRISPHARADRALREMQIHHVAELGLEVWIENQPPWETSLIAEPGRAMFVAQSPPAYHPPSVMTFSSWPDMVLPPDQVDAVLRSALTHAAQNFGLQPGQARSLEPLHAQYGELVGIEADFAGRENGQAIDVRLFVGRTPERFPVVLCAYTLRGKLEHLDEVIRRSWNNATYLSSP